MDVVIAGGVALPRLGVGDVAGATRGPTPALGGAVALGHVGIVASGAWNAPPRPGVLTAGVVVLGGPRTLPPPLRTLTAALDAGRLEGLALAAGAGRTGRLAAVILAERRRRRLGVAYIRRRRRLGVA